MINMNLSLSRLKVFPHSFYQTLKRFFPLDSWPIICIYNGLSKIRDLQGPKKLTPCLPKSKFLGILI